jgi:hypothetical protein
MPHEPKRLSARGCPYAGFGAGIDELVGSRVGVEVSPRTGAGPFLSAVGELAGVGRVGRGGRGAITFDVGAAGFRVAERAFAVGYREVYGDDAGHFRWRLVVAELRCGVVIEVEEIPANGNPCEPRIVDPTLD